MIFKKENQRLPKAVAICPIVECVCEVRFESKLPEAAILGAVYAKFLETAGTFSQLPLLNVPSAIRKGDANLSQQPLYKFASNNSSVQLGTKVIAVSATTPYPGWDKFAPMVKARIKTLAEAGVIASVNRFGLRYINFIDGDVFGKIDLDLRINGQAVDARETTVSFTISDRCTHTVRIRKDVSVNVGPTAARRGSVIDIDSYTSNQPQSLNEFEPFLEQAHVDEKTLFFGMLKPEYLVTLEPTYEQ